MKEKTYVYGCVEVRKTGRSAIKPSTLGGDVTLVEIQPVGEMPTPNIPVWVKETELYEIQGTKNGINQSEKVLNPDELGFKKLRLK